MSILVVMMAAVGEIFQVAGHTVRLGQATIQMMANVRAVEAQMNHDLAHINPNGYLIIRGSYFAPYWEAPGYAEATTTASGTVVQWNGDTSGSSTPPTTSVAYAAGDQVSYGGKFYTCIKSNQSNAGDGPLSSSGDWVQIPAAGYAPQWQDDQLTFLAHGTYHDRTGSNSATPPLSPFIDNLTSNAAAVWYGQLFMEEATASGSTNMVVPGSDVGGTAAPAPNQATELTLGAPPTGATASNFVLGRHVTLLVPGTSASSTTAYAAFPTIAYAFAGTVQALTGESLTAAITSSRADAALLSPTQIETALIAIATGNGGTPSVPQPPLALQAIAKDYCYRFCALPSPAASEVTGGAGQLVNGYFRMTPILLQGVPTFTVQWTDGSINASGYLNWYGLGNPVAGTNATEGAAVETTDADDQYIAIFDAASRQYWPKALKITFTVTDPHNLLQGGRVITEVVRLPQ